MGGKGAGPGSVVSRPGDSSRVQMMAVNRGGDVEGGGGGGGEAAKGVAPGGGGDGDQGGRGARSKTRRRGHESPAHWPSPLKKPNPHAG